MADRMNAPAALTAAICAARARMHAAVTTGGVPAVAAAVVCGGRVHFAGADGRAEEQPCSADKTLFLTASISKTMTALCCLQAADRGELNLDSDIAHYITTTVRNPHFADTPITTRHLLQHLSGLRDDESALDETSPWRSENADCQIPLSSYVCRRLHQDGDAYEPHLWSDAAPPGSAAYHYSNAGFTLAGWVLECATGQSLARLCQDRIFAPLGMDASAFTLQEALRVPGGVVAAPMPPGRHYGVAEYPAAGLRSSASDLAKYLAALTAPPGDCPLLSAASRRQLMPESFRQGLAWWGRDAWYGEQDLDKDWSEEDQVWSHGGFMQGVRTHVHLWPLRRAAIVVLTNSEAEDAKEDVAKALKQVMLAALNCDAVSEAGDPHAGTAPAAAEDADAVPAPHVGDKRPREAEH